MGKNKFSFKKGWLEKIEKNNRIIALNALHAKNEKIHPAYVWNCEKSVILLMIPNAEGWHYLPVKNY